MPYCKSCHTRLDRFNKDRCPICGVENPFEGVSSDTVEITTNIDTSGLNVDYHPRKKLVFLHLFLLGLFGAPYFYIYKYKKAAIWMIINLLCFAGALTGLLFVNIMHPALVVISTFVMFTIVNFIIGIVVYNQPNLKDGHGDFLV